ncbi:MAG TPA: diaminopimelate epimerase [Ferrovibrio sp.]|jgi:diaminopimelate epimerase|uniref:diaminopimelate epimerase n=1 Tax=Ferrovibrio sp. TaxID=1917215 RepID=UPI002B4B5A9D|nr:diaminopimelate epimerase [Ferrovibrio sp.]HLT78467.1 diaminopimelate epimerase [Ferrovibrio sp.]
MTPQGALPFVKMHGLGNDFVVLDARAHPVPLDNAAIRLLGDRRRGIGFDQMITIERSDKADAFMRIHNSDGSEVESCGNAARCIAALLMQETGRDAVSIDTLGGWLQARAGAQGRVTVDMGEPRFDWQAIPLSRAMDTVALDYSHGGYSQPGAVNVGNPHVVFFVADAEAVPLDRIGPEIEHDPLFPQRINVEFAQVISPECIRMRVWERGAGITRACGTGACATLVAAVRRGLSARKAEILLDGGPLTIEWAADNHVYMTGPATEAFRGEIPASFWAALQPA